MHDLIIIGAGPAGLSMAAEARANGVQAQRLLVLETGVAHSWSIRKFFPESKLVEANYKGKEAVCSGVLCISDMSKGEALSYLDQAILDHQISVHYGETVNAITREDDGTFELRSSHQTYKCRVCVIAIGILGRPNKPDYRLPRTLRGRVHYDVTSGEYSGQNILIVGGGDSASEYVQYLIQCGNQVSLSYRRDKFDRMTSLNRTSLLALEERGQATLFRSSTIESVQDVDGRPQVTFSSEAQEDLQFDHIIYALGGSTPANLLREVGIEFEGKSPQVTAGYQTNIDGLYLIGDLSPTSGTIIQAFNTAHEAMRDIAEKHLKDMSPNDPPSQKA